MTTSNAAKSTLTRVSREEFDTYRALWRDVTARAPEGADVSPEDFAAIRAALRLVTRRPDLAAVTAVRAVVHDDGIPGLSGVLPAGDVASLGFHSLFKNWAPPKKKDPGKARKAAEAAQRKKVDQAATALSALTEEDVRALLARLQAPHAGTPAPVLFQAPGRP
jgi:hypothetical protein